MFVPLPNLDDRRWADLVDEARSLIPVFAPEWTDHNAHDPGVTLVEMLAWITETDIYRVDQIPDSHVRAFLSLIGLRPLPPSGARAVLVLALHSGITNAVHLPATTLFAAPKEQLQFRSRRKISVQAASLLAVQMESGGKFRDLTGDWQRGKPLSLFGDNPKPGDSFYLGFEPELLAGEELSLFFELVGKKSSAAERQRILDEAATLARPLCGKFNECGQTQSDPPPPGLPAHHSVELAWEVQTDPGGWQTIDVIDDTRSLSLSGPVVLALNDDAAAALTGIVTRPLAYIRARLIAGIADAAPVARRVLANAVEVEQYAPVWEEWIIARAVVAVGRPPLPGGQSYLYLDFDARGEISHLEFAPAAEDALFVRLLSYQPATNAKTGHVTVEALRIGSGTGAPNQAYRLRRAGANEQEFELYSVEKGTVRKWRRQENLHASGPADLDYVLDAGNGTAHFGDGQSGRVPPAGANIIAVGSTTAGARSNVTAEAISTLDSDAHNTALLGDSGHTARQLARITNVDPAVGGADAERLSQTERRAVEILAEPSRAVTLTDCEELAFATPGAYLARAVAAANQHPGFPCYSAPGFITMVIVPHLPVGRPTPSPGLLSAVSAYLKPRQVIGTRIEVTGPQYLEVAINAEVKTFPGQNSNTVREAVATALEKFLDPLAGGPDSRGWPLGGDVYVSEVVERIAAVPGVDHVLKLEIVVPGCGAQCGNVCLPPLALTVSGKHQIKVS